MTSPFVLWWIALSRFSTDKYYDECANYTGELESEISDALLDNEAVPAHIKEFILAKGIFFFFMDKYFLANDTNTDPEILSTLENDNIINIQQLVAKNPNTPLESLSKLSKDKNFWTRSYVARNINITPEIAERLVDDENDFVRYSLSTNPNIPDYIKEYTKILNYLINYECY